MIKMEIITTTTVQNLHEQSSLNLREKSSGLIAWVPNEVRLVTASLKHVWVWDVFQTQPNNYSIKIEADYVGISCKPNSQEVTFGSLDNSMYVYNYNNKTLINRLYAHKSYVNGLLYTMDGQYLVSCGSWDRSICAWNANTYELLYKIYDSSAESVLSIDVNDERKWIISGNLDGTICIWRLDSGDLITRIAGHSEGVNAVKYLSSLNKLVSGDLEGEIRIWELDNVGKFTRMEHDGGVQSLDYTKNQDVLISGGLLDENIRFWNPITGEQIAQKNYIARGIEIKVSSDGKMIASLGNSGIAKIWNTL